MGRKLLFVLTAIAIAQVQRPVDTFPTKAGELKITPIRHASILIEAGGKALYVDPWSQGSFDGLPKADYILITDFHGDHMDPQAINQIKQADTKIIAPATVARDISSATVMANGQTQTLDAFTIAAMPMYNLKRGPSPGKFYHEKGRGNAYLVTYGGLRIYIAGDTEGIPEMKALKNIDVAFIPMNLPYTMPPDEAAAAVKAFQPKVVYPYHYRGTDTQAFADALKGTKIDVRLRDWYY